MYMTKTIQQRIDEEHDRVREAFKKKYPNADMSKFVVLGEGLGDKFNSKVVFTNGKISYDVGKWWFPITHDMAKYLDLEKWRKGVKMMEDFKKKYPNADMSKFLFDAHYDQPNKDPIIKFYLNISGYYYNVDSNEFKNNKEWVKYLSVWPKIWSKSDTIHNFEINEDKTVDFTKIKIYVNEDEFFEVDFLNFDIENDDENKILNIKLDEPKKYETSSYVASLYAAYIATYKCGISMEHLKYNDKTHKIITSIARYHVYYHMSRFLKSPNKIKEYIQKTEDKIGYIIDNFRPARWVWESREEKGGDNLRARIETQERNGKIRNVRRKTYESGFGFSASYKYKFNYELLVKYNTVSLDDYKRYIAKKSNGITTEGRLLLQMSVKSYVYCILGAQADTLYKIIGAGVNSQETQRIFKKLVADTIVKDDVYTWLQQYTQIT